MEMSKYKADEIEAFYSKDAAPEWRRMVKTPEEEVKLQVHNHYLQSYLNPGMDVLEVGAGPGRFTQTLHELGCRILVSDISMVQLAANRENAKNLGFYESVTDWVKADVTNLKSFSSDSFNAIVAYGGPLSYVFDQAERSLLECHRVLRSGGLVIASVMSLWGTLHRFFHNISSRDFSELIKTGDVTPETEPYTGHYFHMYRAEELRCVLEATGFEVIGMSASNSLSSIHIDTLENIRQDPEKWRELIGMEIEACASPGLVESGTHIIVVARKR
ncbi:hypothetical protein LCGC14_0024160 [marine sediment metagenome]|uniref:Methyltransferase domain-containing protein n=2 Tax=root TaxID=1 RepID=A0A0F9WEQ6_9ZZZZ|nr:class I SAM-dependent methyltransferase [Pseudohongiella sp.]HEA62539.1 class I SAM-dependent methyltransferase [Pseudohongiella sp.]